MKTKKIISLSVALLVALSAILFLPGDRQKAFAESYPQEPAVEYELSEDASTRGLFALLSLNIGSENGQVFAKVKNDFTLFNSVVEVYVMLYSSTTYQSTYLNMTLESSNYIADLNMGEILSTYGEINGVKRYWLARAYYRVDNRQWKEELTRIWLVDVDGTATLA